DRDGSPGRPVLHAHAIALHPGGWALTLPLRGVQRGSVAEPSDQALLIGTRRGEPRCRAATDRSSIVPPARTAAAGTDEGVFPMNEALAERAPAASPRRLPRRVLLQTSAGLAATLAGARPGPGAARESPPCAAGAAPAAPGRVTPERVALAVERAPALARQILERTGVPGMSVAIVFGDAAVYLGGFGVRQLGGDALVDPDTVFQIASV